MQKIFTSEKLKEYIISADNIVFNKDMQTQTERIVDVCVSKNDSDVKFEFSTTYVFGKGSKNSQIYQINKETGEKRAVKLPEENACHMIAEVLWRNDQLEDLKQAEQKVKNVRASVVKQTTNTLTK